MNNFGRFSLWRKSILSATHPSPNGDTFSHKRRLINLSLSALDLFHFIVGSIDYDSLLQWEKVATRGSEASEAVDG